MDFLVNHSNSYSERKMGRTRSGGPRFCADRSEAETLDLGSKARFGTETKKTQDSFLSLFVSCGRWDLNPHDANITRSLVLPVCQFQHFRKQFNTVCHYDFSIIANWKQIVNTKFTFFLRKFLDFFQKMS